VTSCWSSPGDALAVHRTGLVMVLVVLAIILLVLGLEGVDHRPYFRAPYYTETTARLQAQMVTNTAVQGELHAGFGRALLTPTLNAPEPDAAHGRFKTLPLAGFGDRKGRPATGVHERVVPDDAAGECARPNGDPHAGTDWWQGQRIGDVVREQIEKGNGDCDGD